MRSRGLLVYVGMVTVFGLGGCGDDGGKPPAQTATLAATDDGGQPATMIDFGTTSEGQMVSGTLHIANSGTAATSALALEITGDAANDFVLDNAQTTCAAATLAPNASCAIVVLFKPTAAGTRDATLQIVGAAAPLAIDLHGLVSDLAFMPGSLDFGQVETPTTTIKTISLTNSGTTSASIDAITTSGNFHIAASACGATLAAGASCDIIVRFLPALGSNAGALTVASGATSVAAPLAGDGARRITIVRDGGGTGTVTSTPAGITCGATCTGLFDSDVTLTAAPDTGSAFTSWSIGTCGNATTCTVVGDVQPITVYAAFGSTGSSDLQITFAGTGAGEIAVSRNMATPTRCFSSCSVPLTPGDSVWVFENTPSTFGGITGSCTSSATQGSCFFTAVAGTNALTATFNPDAKEQWTHLLAAPVIAVAQDTSGNVIAATATTLYKYSSAGAAVWTQTLAVTALATGPSDTIYVISGTTLQKLDGTGSQIWSVPLGSGVSCTTSTCLAVGADGSVAVQGFTRWDASGTVTETTAITNPRSMIAMDTSGIVYTAYNNAAITTVRRFQTNGTEVTPQWPTSGQAFGQFAIDSDGQLVTSTSGNGEVYFARLSTSGTEAYHRLYTGPAPHSGSFNNGVAPSSAGNLLWWYLGNVEGVTSAGNNSYTVSVFTNANTDVWSLTRLVPVYDNIPVVGMFGAVPVSGAYRSTQVVLGGHYNDLDGSSVGWIQAFSP